MTTARLARDIRSGWLAGTVSRLGSECRRRADRACRAHPVRDVGTRRYGTVRVRDGCADRSDMPADHRTEIYLRGGRRHGFLENVVTHPVHRGQGRGRAVVQAALAEAWARDCWHVLLQSGRKDPAVHVFSRAEFLGFEFRHPHRLCRSAPCRALPGQQPIAERRCISDAYVVRSGHTR